MKLQFKIYNIDVIDCSSCYNLIFPDPKSQEILLKMILRIYESKVVSRIGQFDFWLGDIELQSPNICGDDYLLKKKCLTAISYIIKSPLKKKIKYIEN